MPTSPEVPASTIHPAVRYRDAAAAILWLCDAFGCTERLRMTDDDGVVVHAQLQLGTGLIMLGQHRPGGWTGAVDLDPARSPVSLYCVVADPDAHHARAVAAGADVVYGPLDQPYGSREYGARDLEGIHWSFGTYDPLADDPPDGRAPAADARP